LAYDPTSDVYETVAKMAGSPVLADWTIEMINGSVLSGTGCPVGDLQLDTNAGTFSLKLAFEGEVNKL